jgi:hypothetical protein
MGLPSHGGSQFLLAPQRNWDRAPSQLFLPNDLDHHGRQQFHALATEFLFHPEYFLQMRLSMYLVVLMPAAILGILFYYRKRFLETASAAASSLSLSE